jgi:hypothetical protein
LPPQSSSTPTGCSAINARRATSLRAALSGICSFDNASDSLPATNSWARRARVCCQACWPAVRRRPREAGGPHCVPGNSSARMAHRSATVARRGPASLPRVTRPQAAVGLG